MFTSIDTIKRNLKAIIGEKRLQGYDVSTVEAAFTDLPDSYDELYRIATQVASLPLRDDWQFSEPSDLPVIKAESAWPAARDGADADPAASALRARSAFLGSVTGCMLGKPLEVMADMADIRIALQAHDQWPLSTFVTEDVLTHFPWRHPCWPETVRENIRYVAPDDDINYTVMGMLVLERAGTAFTRTDLARLWMENLPALWTFGPERAFLAKAAMDNTGWPEPAWNLSEEAIERWVTLGNFGVELCGAAIRADAYGHAAMGNPGLAAELAYRDASMTHRTTGVYGTMYNAAVIAAAPLAEEPIDMFKMGLGVVPRGSRFHRTVSDCLDIVEHSADWLSAYEKIHYRYDEYGFCRIHQEAGTMINSAAFSSSTGDGICLQVMQGNDTDSYGATLGSILGAFYGAEGLDPRWLAPFNDRIHTTLAAFHEQRLSAVADRMAALPALVADGAD
ncbi:MAG: ADP-ribosylglycohydrolase family protein [Spirochaetales bacterium]|nr:ADP-ribosylglycohydrolase family protein [Spirochaetales bacterium]